MGNWPSFSGIIIKLITVFRSPDVRPTRQMGIEMNKSVEAAVVAMLLIVLKRLTVAMNYINTQNETSNNCCCHPLSSLSSTQNDTPERVCVREADTQIIGSHFFPSSLLGNKTRIKCILINPTVKYYVLYACCADMYFYCHGLLLIALHCFDFCLSVSVSYASQQSTATTTKNENENTMRCSEQNELAAKSSPEHSTAQHIKQLGKPESEREREAQHNRFISLQFLSRIESVRRWA